MNSNPYVKIPLKKVLEHVGTVGSPKHIISKTDAEKYFGMLPKEVYLFLKFREKAIQKNIRNLVEHTLICPLIIKEYQLDSYFGHPSTRGDILFWNLKNQGVSFSPDARYSKFYIDVYKKLVLFLYEDLYHHYEETHPLRNSFKKLIDKHKDFFYG